LDEILRRRETAGQSSWNFYRSGITLVLSTLVFTTLKRAGRAAGSKKTVCTVLPMPAFRFAPFRMERKRMNAYKT
jgi:hypothetical protein